MRTFYLLFVWLFVMGHTATAQTNYYLKASPNDDPTLAANWGTNLDGTGASPANFTTANQIFVIQTGQTVTVPGAWTVNGIGAKILVQTGGILIANAVVNNDNFELQGTAKYVHGHNGNTITGGVGSSFSANSTVEVTGKINNPLNFGNRSYGNVIWNCTGQTAPSSLNASLTDIKGDFTVLSTGTSGTLRFTNTTSGTVEIAGNLTINPSCKVQITNGAATLTVVLKGDLNNAGTISNSTGTGLIRFGGSTPQSLSHTGTFATPAFDWEVNNGSSLSLSTNLALISGMDFTVNGTLDCGTRVISGAGSFNLNAGATLITKNTGGVASTITVTGTKTYDNAAKFTFNGTSPQTTNLANTTLASLLIDNAAGVNLNTDATVINLTLNNGNLSVSNVGDFLTVSGGSANLRGNQIQGNGNFNLDFGTSLETSRSGGVEDAVFVDGTAFFDASASYIFSGAGGQNTGFAGLGIANAANISINKTSPLDVVNLDVDISLTGTLALQSGVLDIGSQVLSFQASNTPITRTANGILSVSNMSTLNFGNTSVPDGASFTLPNGLFSANPASLSSLNIVRINDLSLGNQSLNIKDALSVGGASTAGDLNLNGQNITLQPGATFTEDRANNAIVTDATASGESNPGGYLEIPTPASVNNISTAADVFTSGTEINGSGIYFGLLSGGSVSFTGDIIRRYHYRGAGKGNPLLYQINGTASNTILGIEFPTQGAISGIDKVYRWDGTQWTPLDATISGERVYTNNPIPGFSSYTLGSSANGLPIRLLRFVAKAEDARTATLVWQTATETNNKGFGIERSTDGRSFVQIAFVEGAGNTLTGRVYSFRDDAFTGFAYYRLRQVDYDGTITYSPLVEANYTGTLSIFPNPTAESIAVRGGGNDALLQVSISDMSGRTLGEWRGSEAVINQALDTHFRRLPPGVYLVMLNGKANRVIKQ